MAIYICPLNALRGDNPPAANQINEREEKVKGLFQQDATGNSDTYETLSTAIANQLGEDPDLEKFRQFVSDTIPSNAIPGTANQDAVLRQLGELWGQGGIIDGKKVLLHDASLRHMRQPG